MRDTLVCECGMVVKVNKYRPRGPYLCAKCRMKQAPKKVEVPVAQEDAAVSNKATV